MTYLICEEPTGKEATLDAESNLCLRRRSRYGRGGASLPTQVAVVRWRSSPGRGG
uniref:Uncharacterized protein n=1 Tax=Arundo donax TaxID=35708 RepID=A0A0A8YYT9_ARUDO